MWTFTRVVSYAILGLLMLWCMSGCMQPVAKAPDPKDVCKKQEGVKRCSFTYQVEWYQA